MSQAPLPPDWAFSFFYPGKKFYLVYILKDRKAMYTKDDELSKELNIRRDRKGYDAKTVSWSGPKKLMKSGWMGYILFHQGRMNWRVVSHELMHASHHWAALPKSFLKIRGHRDEERCAYAHGEATDAFYHKLKRWLKRRKACYSVPKKKR